MKHGNREASRGRSQARRARAETTERPQRAPERRASGDGPSAERERLIAEAAYFRAQARGFVPGRELEDWLQAEAEVDRRLSRS